MSKKLESLNERLGKATAEREETSSLIDKLQAELEAAKAEGKPYAKIQKSIDSATKKNTKAAERAEKLEADIEAASKDKVRKSEKECNPEAFKPITLGTMRASLAEGFMNGKTFKELADETETSEGNIRTHLQNMVNFNGFGYTIEDGKITLIIPEGAEMFAEKPAPKAKKEKTADKADENTSEDAPAEAVAEADNTDTEAPTDPADAAPAADGTDESAE